MTDSNAPDALAEKQTERRAQRIEQVKRWAEYIQSNPPDVWGEQLNTLVDDQLAAARKAGLPVEDYERVEQASEARKIDIHGPQDPE
ncbi:MAG: hypothetical protein BRD23_00665 [Halobacteriales archaeon SW_9_67_25]|jgi:hypothetical protein|nr:MAG: hypothetical protein BRD23_00665 [Halobacteriales archaeon SW_9_67_25]